MGSTITLQNSVDWVRPFVFFRPLNIGTNNEPAISSANLIQQTIVGPPFRWPWNRSTLTFSTANGTQDYTRAVSDFGFIEKATATLSGVTYELEVQAILSEESITGKPIYICSQTDDNAGNIKFRFMSVPNNVYSIIVTYQKKVPLFASLATTWTVPDHFSYIYQHGFMAMMMQYSDDPRWQIYNAKFLTHLLAASEGLDAVQRNIFMQNWYALTGFPQKQAQEIIEGAESRKGI